MAKIGIISDTHGFLDNRILDWFSEVDEIWHAGDIGTLTVLEELAAYKSLRAVYGNIDGREIRERLPEDQIFNCGGMGIWITHIGGYPGKYHSRIKARLKEIHPGLLVCGHSHILKVMYDKSNQIMYMNPGAAGKSGTHQVRTALKFKIVKEKIMDLEVLELARRD
jgi:putative phosphoesterase